MKVLYIGNQRRDAQAAAAALRGVDHSVNVSWAPRAEHAVRWLRENQDIQVVIIEAQTSPESWPAILEPVLNSSHRPAVVMIVPDGPGPVFDSLHPAADDYVVRNDTLPRDLPAVVTRAVARTHEHAQSPPASSPAEARLAAESTSLALLSPDLIGRADLEQRLTAATTALHEAERRHHAAIEAAERRLAERQAQYEIGMARATANWEMVDEQLRAAAIEVERARQHQATAEATVDRLSQRDTELRSQLADAVAAQNALQLRLADTEAAVEAAQSRIERERLAAAEELTEQRREFQALFEQEHERRCGIQNSLTQAITALENAEKQHFEAIATAESQHADAIANANTQHAEAIANAEMQVRQLEANLRLSRLEVESRVADIERLTQRENDLSAALTKVTVSRDELERRLAATEAAFDDATTRAMRDRLAASKKAAERAAELDGQLRREQSARASLEQAVAEAAVALAETQQRHEAALARAATELAERRVHFEQELSYATSDRNDLAQRLNETESTVAQLRRDRETLAALLDQLTALETDLNARLVEALTARDGLERQLADATRAVEQSVARHTELEAHLLHERETRVALEHALSDAQVARDAAQRRHDDALTAARDEFAGRQAHFDAALSATAAERDRRGDRVSEIEAALDGLRREYQSSTADVERLTQREAGLISQITELAATREALTTELANARAAALETERSLQMEADALRTRSLEQAAQFDVVLAQEQLEHESRRAEMQECARKLTIERDSLHESLTIARDTSQQLQQTLTATASRLEAATHRAETLQKDADQLPRLIAQLDELRADNNRLFEHAGQAMFRCTPAGALVHANRACTTLVGRRMLEQPAARFAAAVFEAPDALLWLIERCLSTRAKESIETAWRRNDGGRLHVRVQARLLPSDIIEVIVEDLTRLRVLEERLDQAHRMEAVGRLASEVAVTCSNLLNDIHQNGQQWLAEGDQVDVRQQGEHLIDEVRRAADLLHQLAAFGDEQARTPMLVDLNTLIRDLEPVLKRLAGDHVEVRIGHSSSPLNVEAQIERVERLLVNLASYGRERLPSGGRLRVDIGTEVVDRHFTARHRNVRLGLHALITITGTRAPARTDKGPQVGDDASPRSQGRMAAARPGVNVGTLQRLVSECGGHLWMKIEPDGDIVAKIRLPLSSSNDQLLSRRGPEARGVRPPGPRHAVR